MNKSICDKCETVSHCSKKGCIPLNKVGWKFVPIEPTPDMLESMDKGSASQTWKNMLSAAPNFERS